MGVWIETWFMGKTEYIAEVTPCVGVWIETKKKQADDKKAESHPAWVCGLKLSKCVYGS